MATKSEALSTAISVMLTKQPFFANVLLTLHKVVETRDVPTAATDQKTVFVNPDFIASLDAQEGAFLMAHESMHTVLNHVVRAYGYVDLGIGPDGERFRPDRFNKAADYIVNQILVEAGMKAPKSALLDRRFGADQIVEEVYGQLGNDPEEENPQPGNQPGSGQPGKGFDQHLRPSPDAPDGDQIKQAVIQAAQAAKLMGKMPAGMDRLVKQITEVKVDWKKELRDLMTARSGRDEQSWSKLNRRKLAMASLMEGLGHEPVILPGMTGFQLGTTVLTIDTSGSVGDKELEAFMSHCSEILTTCRPEKLYVLWVDSEVAGVDEVQNAADLMSLTPKGGGGTCMPAAFDWVDQEQLDVDLLVILTDMYTPYGSAQPYPVIWVSTTPGKVAPHGQTIQIEI